MFIIIYLGEENKFKKSNYNTPKALIKIFDKPILYYLLDNLNLKNVDFICIPYNREYLVYNLEDTLSHDYPNIKFKFIKLLNNTFNVIETINITLKYINNNDTPVLYLDVDNFYTNDIITDWNFKNKLFVFKTETNTNNYSYVNIHNNKIIDIVEKEKISDYACSGAYGFSSSSELLTYTQNILDNKKNNNEYFISIIIKEMIKNNIIFEYSNINKNNYHCLGTPLQLRYFYNNYPKISSINNNCCINSKRICFNLDNTLVSYPKIPNDYTSVKPIEHNIRFLKYLKQIGNIIIIYTSRKMDTYNGNIGKITFDTLSNFNIPFDEIYFGKPYADIYIDNSALNCYTDLEKELGFYIEQIDTRHFNNLELNTIETYKKTSFDLSGEIYYYNNIPSEIKDLFPIFIDYDINNKWYIIDKIKGYTTSSLYVNEQLDKNTLIHIMNTIKRVQNVKIDDISKLNNINIYYNYASKFKNRYESYDYSRFKNHNEIFNLIYNKLINYENSNLGKCVIIHGDFVMTNILINNYDKIKFIDMRGKIGDNLSIYGDFLYDWSKLYQSLIGYDKILLNKHISQNYEINMINCFKTYFIDLYSEEYFEILKTIVKSLLFSLIPLHNNDLCFQYYELIQSII